MSVTGLKSHNSNSCATSRARAGHICCGEMVKSSGFCMFAIEAVVRVDALSRKRP